MIAVTTPNGNIGKHVTRALIERDEAIQQRDLPSHPARRTASLCGDARHCRCGSAVVAEFGMDRSTVACRLRATEHNTTRGNRDPLRSPGDTDPLCGNQRRTDEAHTASIWCGRGICCGLRAYVRGFRTRFLQSGATHRAGNDGDAPS